MVLPGLGVPFRELILYDCKVCEASNTDSIPICVHVGTCIGIGLCTCAKKSLRKYDP